MRLTLFVEHQNASQVFTMTNTTRSYVGRENADVVIASSFCSKLHAILFQNIDGELVLKDLGSRNGTYVYEQKVNEAKLAAGGKFRIGGAVITVLAYEAGSEFYDLESKRDVSSSLALL